MTVSGILPPTFVLVEGVGSVHVAVAVEGGCHFVLQFIESRPLLNNISSV